MKEDNYKHIDDLLGKYISLLDEQLEIPLLVEKTKEKYEHHLTGHNSSVYKRKETNDMFKIFSQVKKHEDRSEEIKKELTELENHLKEFLSFLKGGKIAYEKKEDNGKSK